jgi:hypothetical protein
VIRNINIFDFLKIPTIANPFYFLHITGYPTLLRRSCLLALLAMRLSGKGRWIEFVRFEMKNAFPSARKAIKKAAILAKHVCFCVKYRSVV